MKLKKTSERMAALLNYCIVIESEAPTAAERHSFAGVGTAIILTIV